MTTFDNTLSYSGDGAERDKLVASPYLVRAFHCLRPTAPSSRLSIGEVECVVVTRGESDAHQRVSRDGAGTLELAAADGWMSAPHFEIRRNKSSYHLTDLGSKNGTFVNGDRLDNAELADGDIIQAGGEMFLFRSRVQRSVRQPADANSADLGGPIGSLNPSLARMFHSASTVAPTNLSIVALGESGAGKEVFARWVHERSGRPGDFVAINCAALPEKLIEGELFGAKKGAYSGADKDRGGLVRASDKGTLFLDEIGEMPLAAQVKLLRVIQEREVVALGDTKPVSVDLRIIAASNVDLTDAVDRGAFRSDLWARIAGLVVELPPLRDRIEDLGWIAGSLLTRIAGPKVGDVTFDRAAARALFVYDWPLNVRELEQALAAAIPLSEGERISRAHLPSAVAHAERDARADLIPTDDADLRVFLDRKLRSAKGNVSEVGRQLGKARVQIRRWCKRLDLDPDSYR